MCKTMKVLVFEPIVLYILYRKKKQNIIPTKKGMNTKMNSWGQTGDNINRKEIN